MRVKICGITNAGDAAMAVDEGADALGFIFAESSPRFIAPEKAKDIIASLPPFVTPVGVVMNLQREEINRLTRNTGIRCLQFHGEESPQDIQGFQIPVYKAFRVGNGFDPSILSAYDASAYLLDAYVHGEAAGGTGKTIDWELAARAKTYGRIILAGGIRPENVADAVRKVQPYAIDVNSGIESVPGKKDPVKLRRLFSSLREMQH